MKHFMDLMGITMFSWFMPLIIGLIGICFVWFLFAFETAPTEPNGDGKKFWLSKTFWVNLLAIGAMVIQSFTSFVISPESQILLIGVINLVLRAITKQPIEW